VVNYYSLSLPYDGKLMIALPLARFEWPVLIFRCSGACSPSHTEDIYHSKGVSTSRAKWIKAASLPDTMKILCQK
jgi:hypothetical protein